MSWWWAAGSPGPARPRCWRATRGIGPARVALLAPAAPRRPRRAPPELRVAALSRASEHVLRAAGAWQRLDRRGCAPTSACVCGTNRPPRTAPAALCFDAADVGEPNLGYIAETARCSACLPRELSRRRRHAAIEAELERLDDRPTRRGCTRGADELDGAPGGGRRRRAFAGARAAPGLSVRTRDYRQLAIVATVATAQPHAHTAWQRFLRTGPLALLPLFDGRSSLVWSLDEQPARELLRHASRANSNSGSSASALALGDMRLASERASFPLQQRWRPSLRRAALRADRRCRARDPSARRAGRQPRLARCGRTCEAVAAAPALREDPGALRLLRRYEQQRRTHNLAMDAAMSAFQAAFAPRRAGRVAASTGAVRLVNRSGPLKRAFARQALGISRRAAAAARAGG